MVSQVLGDVTKLPIVPTLPAVPGLGGGIPGHVKRLLDVIDQADTAFPGLGEGIPSRVKRLVDIIDQADVAGNLPKYRFQFRILIQHSRLLGPLLRSI